MARIAVPANSHGSVQEAETTKAGRVGRRAAVAAAVAVAVLLTAWLGLAWTSEARTAPPPWERAWGKDVVSGGRTGFEICTVAANCKFGSSIANGPGGELKSPTDIASDAAGNVYVADESLRRIEKFDSDGNFIRAWGKDVVAGNAETGYEICAVAAQCKPGASGSRGGEFNFLTGVTVDVSGSVYVADGANRHIQKFDSSGNFLRMWGKDVSISSGDPNFEICTIQSDCRAGQTGSMGGDLDFPLGLEVDDAGNVYVIDSGTNHRIQKYTSAGVFQRAWGKDVVAGGDTDFEICAVQADCAAGAIGSLGGELSQPLAVATDGSVVYVVDGSNERIEKFDASGNFLRAWGKDVVTGGDTGPEICTVAADCKTGVGGGLGGEFVDPSGIGVDPEGDVHTTEQNGHRVQEFDPSGSFLSTWGKDVVNGGGTGSEICTVAADCKTGASGTLGGELSSPDGVAFDDADHMYVNEATSRRINRLSLDATPPDTTIDLGPDDPTNDSTPTFGFSADDPGATFACRLHAQADPAPAFSACSGPGEEHTPGTPLADGDYVFDVVASDAIGNTDPTPASQTFTVDTTAPVTQIDSGPAEGSQTNDTTPSFGFSADEAGSSFECSLVLEGDPASFDACSGPGHAHTPDPALAEGDYTFQVRATDAAANTDASPANQTFTVDTTAPAEPTFTATDPASPANQNNPKIKGLADSSVAVYATADCSGAPAATGDSTDFSAAGIAVTVGDDSETTFRATASDEAGNTSECSTDSITYVEDSTAPATQIDSGPAESSQIKDTTPSFTFSADAAGSSFECSLVLAGDPASFDACSGPGHAHTPDPALAEGDYTFQVRATDSAANTDLTPVVRDFTIDTTAPATTIDSGPADPASDPTPTFTFSASEGGSGFECRTDGGGFSPCTSPHTTASLADGSRTFEVRATDAAGNTEPTPASQTFTVDTTAPVTTIDNGPTNGSTIAATTPSLGFS